MKEQIYNRLQIEREGRRRAVADSVHTPLLLSSPPAPSCRYPLSVAQARLSLGCCGRWEASEGKEKKDLY